MNDFIPESVFVKATNIAGKILETGPSLRYSRLHLPSWRFSPIVEGMEVHFTPETEKKLSEFAAHNGGRTAVELVQDVVEGYFAEALEVRDMLDSRYDDLESGRVKPIPGDEVIARLRAKSAAHRASRNESV